MKQIVLPIERNCFACSPSNPIGLKMKIYTDGAFLYSLFTPNEQHTSWGQIMHGGIASTLMDELSGWGIMCFTRSICVTLILSSEFISPLLVNQQILIKAAIDRVEKDKNVYTVAEIYNEKGKLCAKAQGIFALIDNKKAKRMKIMSADDIDKITGFLNDLSI